MRCRSAQDTVTGFLLAGVGSVDSSKHANYLIVNKSASARPRPHSALALAHTTAATSTDRPTALVFVATKHSDVEAAFQRFTSSSNVGILLISQPIAESIRYLVAKHKALIPTILEIPTKEEVC